MGVWPWPVKSSLSQRLASSAHNRIKGGVLVPKAPRECAAVEPARFQTCQWIMGDPRDEGGPVFCDQQAQRRKPYCAAHCARAYEPPAVAADD